MTNHVLVALDGSDRIEQFLPYIERVVQPGLKVTFLFQYSIPVFYQLIGQLLAIHTGVTQSRLPDQFGRKGMMQQQMQLALDKVAPAGLALHNKGVEISVTVFTGSVRKVVHEYAKIGDVHLVLMHHSHGNWLPRAARTLTSLLRFFKPQPLPPILLLHPSSILERLT
jgi:hypothetical protein